MPELYHRLKDVNLTSFDILFWLLKKDKYKCPRCNMPLLDNDEDCPNCGQPLDWKPTKL